MRSELDQEKYLEDLVRIGALEEVFSPRDSCSYCGKENLDKAFQDEEGGLYCSGMCVYLDACN